MMLLPPGMRCSAYWYAWQARLLTGDGDLDFLKELGLRAARLARWEGIPAWQVPEGPYWVHMWPEHVWSRAADQMAEEAAVYGSWNTTHAGPHGYWQAGDYDVTAYPGPQGEQASFDIGY